MNPLLSSYLATLIIFLTLLTTVLSQGDPNASACLTLDKLVSICGVLTPGFTSFTNFYFQAPCLCYSSTYWNPDIYDNLLYSCYSGYRTASPSAYSVATASMKGDFITTACHKAGNVLSLPQATGTAPFTGGGSLASSSTPTIISPITSTLPPDPNRSACATINAAEAFCNSKSTGFSTLSDFRSKAPCYCYSGLVYFPSYFDIAWGSCMQYLSTSATSDLSRLASSGAPVLTSTPCAAVGDVLDIRSTGSWVVTSVAAQGASGATVTRTGTTTTATSSTRSDSTRLIDTHRLYQWLLLSITCVALLL